MLSKLKLPRPTLSALGANPRRAQLVITSTVVILSIASVAAVYGWLLYNPTVTLAAEVPGHDGAPPPGSTAAAQIDLAGTFESFDGVPSELVGEWTSFRGPNQMNIAENGPELADSWPAGGPKILWTVKVGDGYAAPAVRAGRVYLMDYDMDRKADAIRCLSLDDGKEIWRRFYNLSVKRNHGMSRTIPAVTDKYLVTIGPKCHVVCLDAGRGDFRWGIDLQKDYGTNEPLWYAGQCPLIVDDRAIIAPAGDDILMMAVHCETGKVEWTTPNPNQWDMSHASIIPMTLLGKKQYVYSAVGGIVGVSAEPANMGELLWMSPRVGNVIAPSPVQVSDNEIFATSGYSMGSRLLRLSESGGKWEAEIVYDRPPAEVLACEQQTPVFHNGLLYGIMPKDAGGLKGQFVCYKPDGSMVWSSGQDIRFGIGPFLLADDKFYILDDEATLTMIDATKDSYVQLGQADILEGHDAWGPLAIAGSRMLLRDMNTLACIELGVGG